MDYEKAWKELRSTVIDEIEYWDRLEGNETRAKEALVIMEEVKYLEEKYDL